MYKLAFLCTFFALSSLSLPAQSSVFFRNNSNFDLEVAAIQAQGSPMATQDYSLLHSDHHAWFTDRELFWVKRDSGILAPGDSLRWEVALISNADTLRLAMKLKGQSGPSSLSYGAAFSGQTHIWFNDGSFHEIQGNFGGKDLRLKFRPENDDNGFSRDLLFVLHEEPVYEVDSLDFQNPEVLNVISYNVKFLPLFIGGTTNNLRAGIIPPRMRENVDVVIFQEAFDPFARDPVLEPAMQAEGFIYDSGILNDYLPFNGGVIIYSRWPIVATDEIDFALCGPNSGDCFANKGIKYAAVEKLGRRYHLFGTHMDAGSDPQDLQAKNLQYKEMRDFIAARNIPANEPVLFGGDFNTGPTSSNMLWENMLDSLHPWLPDHYGFYSSTMSFDTAKIIDHIWSDGLHLLPIEGRNEIFTLRGIQDNMWDVSEYSDHRTVLGRFSYPSIDLVGGDTVLCPGDVLALSVQVGGLNATYQWKKDGINLPGATQSSYNPGTWSIADSGNYSCAMSYEAITGRLNDTVNRAIHPNGPDTLLHTIDIPLGLISVTPNCGVGREDKLSLNLQFYPQPLHAHSHLAYSVETRLLTEDLLVEVFDLSGRRLHSERLSKEKSSGKLKWHVSQSGMYLLKVTHQGKTHVEKIMVHH